MSPDYQGHGIGTRAFAYLPTLFPDWQRIELVTPADKTENIRFYTHRYGCTVNGTEQDGHVEVVRLVRKRAEV